MTEELDVDGRDASGSEDAAGAEGASGTGDADGAADGVGNGAASGNWRSSRRAFVRATAGAGLAAGGLAGASGSALGAHPEVPPPENVSVSDAGPYSLTATWDDVPAACRVGVRTDAFTWRSGTVEGTAHTVEGLPLTPGTSYEVFVEVSDGYGGWNASEPVTASTPAPPSSAPGAPSDLSVDERSKTSVALSWSGTSAEAVETVVAHARIDGGELQSIRTTTVEDGQSASLTELTESEAYAVWVLHEFQNGGRSAAVGTTVETAGDWTAPSAPSNLRVTGRTESSLTVHWDGATDEGGAGLVGYEVVAEDVTASGHGASPVAEQTVDRGVLGTTVEGLEAGRLYEVTVSAVDGGGNRSTAVSVSAETPSPGDPSVVSTSLEVLDSGGSSPSHDATIALADDGVTVEIDGQFAVPESCYGLRIDDATFDGERLTVEVRTGKPDTAEGCLTVVTQKEYAATVECSSAPSEVVLDHVGLADDWSTTKQFDDGGPSVVSTSLEVIGREGGNPANDATISLADDDRTVSIAGEIVVPESCYGVAIERTAFDGQRLEVDLGVTEPDSGELCLTAVYRKQYEATVECSARPSEVVLTHTGYGEDWSTTETFGDGGGVAPPENLSVVETGLGHVTVSWDPPSGDVSVDGYRISTGGETVTEVPSAVTEFTLGGLDPGSPVTVNVATAAGTYSVVASTSATTDGIDDGAISSPSFAITRRGADGPGHEASVDLVGTDGSRVDILGTVGGTGPCDTLTLTGVTVDAGRLTVEVASRARQGYACEAVVEPIGYEFAADLDAALEEVVVVHEDGEWQTTWTPGEEDVPTVDGVVPTDPDDDGVYEDLNANNRTDSDDVVVYFENYDEPAMADNASFFDLNGNERTDADDVVQLFESL